ncbi:carboxylesterase/lipase family protein [Saccharothrix australiensis]|uniref:Carboxylic ester hydrolase n=1 Tax=Saccharothrix australiensis TaxID=2072 RepID=A0A495W0H5_9PSEU|nr:carboxylesterase family protein [Saccharothrix australiensis]RKT54610.1 carboxylesterase type B [Saccharothrix australiensis]
MKTARRSHPLVLAMVTLLLVGGATSATPATPPPCSPGTGVTTPDGPVCGLAGERVTSWLGIPFAQPPVGELRWRPPVRVAPRADTFAATEQGDRCPQPGRPSPRISEDCLNLNVRVPRDAGDRPLPVMVQIHGGGFLLFGPADGSLPAASGRVISVEINYRLGIMGFLAAAQFGPHAGNYALQDQQEALRWVRRNIAAFGGDPGNVTIYGASAGGSSVCSQLVSPSARGLFHKGIIQSGVYNSLFGNNTSWQAQDCKSRWPTQGEAHEAAARFAAAVGCGDALDVAVCLRAVPVDKLVAQAGDGLSPDSGTVAPVVDGRTIPVAPAKAIEDGRLHQVPVMTGVARDDVQLDPADTPERYRELVREQYGRHAPEVFARYPLERFPEPSAFLAYRTVVADSNSVCPSLVLARRLAEHVPVFAYQVDNPDSPPASWLDRTKPNGAYHVSENVFLYAAGHDLWNANQNAYSRQLVAQWTGFARTGDPTVTGTPLWTRHTADDPRVMSLLPAGNSVMTGEIPRQHHCDFWDGIAPRPR